MASPTDAELVEMAKARVSFKTHLVAYVLVNLFLVAIWWFDVETVSFQMGDMGFSSTERASFWPVWSILGWGLGLAFHAYSVYGGGQDWEARELEKLREKHGRP